MINDISVENDREPALALIRAGGAATVFFKRLKSGNAPIMPGIQVRALLPCRRRGGSPNQAGSVCQPPGWRPRHGQGRGHERTLYNAGCRSSLLV